MRAGAGGRRLEREREEVRRRHGSTIPHRLECSARPLVASAACASATPAACGFSSVCSRPLVLSVVAAASARPASTPVSKAQIAAKAAQAQSVLAQVQAINVQLGRNAEAYDGARFQLQTLDARLAANRTLLVQARRDYRKAQRNAQELLVQLYTDDQPQWLDIVLGATSFTDLINRIDTAQTVATNDAAVAAADRADEGDAPAPRADARPPGADAAAARGAARRTASGHPGAARAAAAAARLDPERGRGTPGEASPAGARARRRRAQARRGATGGRAAGGPAARRGSRGSAPAGGRAEDGPGSRHGRAHDDLGRAADAARAARDDGGSAAAGPTAPAPHPAPASAGVTRRRPPAGGLDRAPLPRRAVPLGRRTLRAASTAPGS